MSVYACFLFFLVGKAGVCVLGMTTQASLLSRQPGRHIFRILGMQSARTMALLTLNIHHVGC